MISLHHRILAGAYRPLKAAGSVKRRLGLLAGDRVRVLLLHDIAPADEERFRSQLRWLAKSWNFVTPAQFEAMVAGEERISGRNLLVSFDDGFASNRVIAERVLNPMGIRALFFVMSDFAAIDDRLEARRFIADRVQPGISLAEDLPQHWTNLRWIDLEALLEQGHTIGAHTRTHARLSDATTAALLHDEIVTAGDTLADRLGVPIRHFAYTFGDVSSVSREALEMASRRFDFVHSGVRGNNVRGISPFAIRRDSAATQDAGSSYYVFPDHVLGALLEGAADFRYRGARAQLDEWTRALRSAACAGSAC